MLSSMEIVEAPWNDKSLSAFFSGYCCNSEQELLLCMAHNGINSAVVSPQFHVCVSVSSWPGVPFIPICIQTPLQLPLENTNWLEINSIFKLLLSYFIF